MNNQFYNIIIEEGGDDQLKIVALETVYSVIQMQGPCEFYKEFIMGDMTIA